MKIALGTVQFGMQYGVANSGERVSAEEAKRILSLAYSHGVDSLDTAAAYGNSEQLLGGVGVEGFKVVSKLPPRASNTQEASKWVSDYVERSLTNLNLSSLYGLMLHRPLELLSNDGEVIYNTLRQLQKDGVVKNIGVSVYEPEDLEKLLQHYSFDLVQAPMNIVDCRMLDSGWLTRLKQSGTEVHIRSAFLQGLLLMKASERPAYFNYWSELFRSFDQWCSSESVTALQACLGFLNSQSSIDKIVVGVDSAEQLQSILDAADSKIYDIPSGLHSFDKALVNPANWKL